MAEQRLNPSLNDKVKGLLGDLERDIITPLLGIKKLFFSGTETANALTGTENVTILQGGEPVVTTTQDIADLAAGLTAPYKLYAIRYNASKEIVFEYLEDNSISFIVEGNEIQIAGLSFDAKIVANALLTSSASELAYTLNRLALIGGGPFANRFLFSFKKIESGGNVSNISSVFSEGSISSITIELKVYN